MKIIILIVVILAAALLVYAVIENTLMLKVSRYGSGNIRAVQISDLHKRRFGGKGKRVIEAVKELSPHVIFVTGDLVSRTEKDLSTAENVLNELCKISHVYIILGNHEQTPETDIEKRFLEMVKSTEAVLLRNERKRITLQHRDINLIGLELPYSVYKKNGGYSDLDKVDKEAMIRLLGYPPEGENVLLAHNPLFAEAYAEWGADVTFSGHVHGGSVRLFGKGLLSPERKFFPKYDKGVYTVGNMKLVVSAGLGKPRLFDPPEIVVYQL